MRSIPILIIALTIAVVVPHVCAENVTSFSIDPSAFSLNNTIEYPQEYYNALARADSITEAWHNNRDNWQVMSYNDVYGDGHYTYIIPNL